MPLDIATCYRALAARDRRFDGLFYVAVTTTGIYCRPICPARTPGRDRCRFFTRAAEAEREGFRACFRCRPEVAPGQAPVDSIPRLVRAAAARIEAGYLNEHSTVELGAALGVTDRHLRRAMEAELGIAPVELAQTGRLALAKQLLQDTAMPLTDVAYESGFASVRRFNALFKARFARSPSALRRDRGSVKATTAAGVIGLRLDYRPPLDWSALTGFLGARAIPGVERLENGVYRRAVTLGKQTGWIALHCEDERNAIRVEVSLSLAPKLMEISARVRALLDLDARPDAVTKHLGKDAVLSRWVKATPGLRVPGAFEGFEMATRAILGQQVSVAGATTLTGRLAKRFGTPALLGIKGLDRFFPSAETMASASIASVAALGLPASRARTIVELAKAVAEARIDLSAGAEPASTIAALLTLFGIGDWTAQYLAMRALRWPDAFPAGDLGVRKALGVKTAREAEARAAAWRPWRAYAAMYLWHSLA